MGAPKPPAPMSSTLGVLQLGLTLHAHFGHDQVSAVALDLVVAEGDFLPRGTGSSTRYRGHDADHVGVLKRSFFPRKVSDVLVVDVDVDEVSGASLHH